VDLAEGNGQMLRGHNCVWYNQLPSWVTSGNFDATELSSIVVNHCSTIVGYWAGKMYAHLFIVCDVVHNTDMKILLVVRIFQSTSCTI
jgi:GH35 family endo-1,4-beta-xylanase